MYPNYIWQTQQSGILNNGVYMLTVGYWLLCFILGVFFFIVLMALVCAATILITKE